MSGSSRRLSSQWEHTSRTTKECSRSRLSGWRTSISIERSLRSWKSSPRRQTEISDHAGSTTFKRKDLGKGFEPDSCFYIGHAGQVRGKAELDPIKDPPPRPGDRRRHHALLPEPVPDIRPDGRAGGMAF